MGSFNFELVVTNYCRFIDLCISILCLQLLYVLHSIIPLLRGGWDLCRQTVLNRLRYCYLQPFAGRLQEILRFNKNKPAKPNPRPIASLDPLQQSGFTMNIPFFWEGCLHITLKKSGLGGGFKYFFIFTPTWGRVPF